MADKPSTTGNSRHKSDATYLEEVIFQNESLLVEVESLRSILCEKGLDQLRHLRSENEDLRQRLSLAESQLHEKKHQLEVLESTYARFDGIHSTLREVAEQKKELSELRERGAELEQQNAALKSELMRLHETEETSRAAQHAAERRHTALEAELAHLRTALQAADERHAAAEHDKRAAEEALAAMQAQKEQLASHVAQLEERRAGLEAHKTQFESQRVELEAQTRILESQRVHLEEEKAELEKQLEVTGTDASARSRMKKERLMDVEAKLVEQREAFRAAEAKLQAAEEQKSQLDAELQVARAAIVQKEQMIKQTFTSQQQKQEEATKKELRRLETALKDTEAELAAEKDKNLEMAGRLQIVEAEKDAMVRRYGMNHADVAELQRQVETLKREKSEKESMQVRFHSILNNKKLVSSDIKLLFEELLDYQERIDQELRTRLLIQQIQTDDQKKVYEANIRKLRSQNETLKCEADLLRQGRADSAGDGRPDLAEDDTPQRQPVPPNVNSPSPAQPKAPMRHPVKTSVGSEGSLMSDLWRPSPSEGAQPAERHHDPVGAVWANDRQEQNMIRCARCTLLNKPNTTACDACGARL